MDPTLIDIGSLVKAELDRLGRSQDDLAKRMKTSRLSVNEICNNKRGISADMAIRLERVLPGMGLTAAQLLELRDKNRQARALSDPAFQEQLARIRPLRRPRVSGRS